jgi:DNA polymerase-4
MNLPLNKNIPTIMHIDLNSCFATVEQQAYPNLRGRPIVIAAYTSPNGCVLAPSIEAKRLGIKTGMTVRDARLLCRDVIVRDPDPVMIRHAHLKFKNVLKNYSPNVIPKSIDELVVDFTGTLALKRGLKEVGFEIKKEIRQAVGEWISCNIGISTNRFLAKLAAGLHKPDGLDIITADNLEKTYSNCMLLELNGINTHFQARLNANGIFTPSDFLHTSLETLQNRVFKSINGYYWYLRLRGWEIDAVEFGRKSYGQSYALKEPTQNPQKIARLMMKLCEKMGRRLRRHNFTAFGLHVATLYTDFSHWHTGRTFSTNLYTVQELFTKAIFLLNQQPERKKVRTLAVSCYHLSPTQPEQLTIEEINSQKRRKVQDAVDKINNRWGEYVITPLLMLGMNDVIVDRIAFGGAKEIEDLYAQPS